MSNALPLSMSNLSIPAAPASRPRPTVQLANVARAPSLTAYARPAAVPLPPPVPRTTPERVIAGRERIRASAEAGRRIRSYEVALDLDMSEFHFARQFRAAFGRSPHVYYDEVRAECARALLRDGLPDSDVARRIGFRRPAELRALLSKRAEPASA